MLYFAYGSNLSLARLQQRCPSASIIGRAQLSGHELRFHKRGQDGSGKCDIYKTDIESSIVWGGLFTIARDEIHILDIAEGLGNGYEKKQVILLGPDSNMTQAFTYYATAINPAAQPFDWYKNHVMIGAQQMNLPAHYIQQITNIPTIIDPDPQRAQKEFAIHKPN